ncbi:hypothetical protein HDU97_010431 [Phlyctochytrium planicorne]|nr:hypothetical protein HDU97_010431 [Phlyctochytrium planicorne]
MINNVPAPTKWARLLPNGTVTSMGRLKEDDESFWWGFEIDWDLETPFTISQRIGSVPPVITSQLGKSKEFMNGVIDDGKDIYSTGFDADKIILQAREIARVNSIMQLRVVPGEPLDAIGEAILKDLAIFVRQINAENGVAILLAFAPDMNAMVWAPSYQMAYGAGRLMPFDNDTLTALDTNQNGFVDQNDDAYGPYYPGDDFVDWVGLSVFNIQSDPKTLQYIAPPADYLSTALQGDIANPHTNFYSRFSASTAKPMMLSATGAGFKTNGTISDSSDTREELSIKRAWWSQILKQTTSYKSIFPNLRLVSNVEAQRDFVLSDGSVTRVDYAWTMSYEVRNSFLKDSNKSKVRWGGSTISVNCRGEVDIVD